MAKKKDADAELAGEERKGTPFWKKALLALAGLFVIAGLVLRFSGGAEAQPAGDAGESGMVGPASSLAPGTGSEGGTDGSTGGASDWSPFFLQGGFGFFLGFSIGTVLRTFFKVFAFGAGLFFLLLIGLQYAGVEIPWDSIRETYDNLAGRVAANADGFMDFLQGAIPATAFSGAGLVAGLKRD